MREKFEHRTEHIDDQMIKVEVNLDDTTGETLGYVMDHLFALGANDVFYVPIFMKKNRPAVMLQLLCDASKLDKMKELLFKETTTLGIRTYPVQVHRLERTFQKVETEWGAITVKIGFHQGELVQVSPEYEDCKRVAEHYQVPLKDIYRRVWALFEEHNKNFTSKS